MSCQILHLEKINKAIKYFIIDIDMEKTLAENDIEDETQQYEDLDVPID